jgi:hypothetical protein
MAALMAQIDGRTRGIPVVMAEDYQQKYVGMVAAVIGGVVLFLGLVGIIVNLS